MAYTTTFGLTFKTVAEMKKFAAEHGIVVDGHKSFSQTWLTAIESYLSMQATAIESAQEAQAAAEVVAAKVEKIAVKVVEVLTSETAIEIYRTVLRWAIVAIAFILFTIGKIGKWCWEHRDRTAVYHWVQDAAESKIFWRVKVEVAIARWIVGNWVHQITLERDRLVQSLRDRMETIRDRVGLGCVVIEIQ